MTLSIHSIPAEIRSQIFTFLAGDKTAVVRALRVCKVWHENSVIQNYIQIFEENFVCYTHGGFPKFITDVFDSRQLSIWRLPEFDQLDTIDKDGSLNPNQMVDSKTGKEQSGMRYYNPKTGGPGLLFLIQRCDDAYFEYKHFSIEETKTELNNILLTDPFPSTIEKFVAHFIFPRTKFMPIHDSPITLHYPIFAKENGRIYQKKGIARANYPIGLWIKDVLSWGPWQKGDFRLVSTIPQIQRPVSTRSQSNVSQLQKRPQPPPRQSGLPSPPLQALFKKVFPYWIGVALVIGYVIGTAIRKYLLKNLP
jgi:hypothetical protein